MKSEHVMNFFIDNIKNIPNDQLANLMYLSDWKNCLEHGHQLTKVVWEKKKDYSQFGLMHPTYENFIPEIINRFSISKIKVSKKNLNILNFVLNFYNNHKNDTNYINYIVRSTFPYIIFKSDYQLNLKVLAKAYKIVKPLFLEKRIQISNPRNLDKF